MFRTSLQIMIARGAYSAKVRGKIIKRIQKAGVGSNKLKLLIGQSRSFQCKKKYLVSKLIGGIGNREGLLNN